MHSNCIVLKVIYQVTELIYLLKNCGHFTHKALIFRVSLTLVTVASFLSLTLVLVGQEEIS